MHSVTAGLRARLTRSAGLLVLGVMVVVSLSTSAVQATPQDPDSQRQVGVVPFSDSAPRGGTAANGVAVTSARYGALGPIRGSGANRPTADRASAVVVTPDPPEITVSQGDRAHIDLHVERTGGPGPVIFTVDGVPLGAIAAVRPNPLPRNRDRARLGLFVGRQVAEGDYPLTVNAVFPGRQPRGGTTTVTLHVVAGGLPFTISGDLAGQLAPGRRLPLDLTLTNPNGVPIRVTNLYVGIDHVDEAHAAACPAHPNFAVTQFSGRYHDLRVPTGGTVRLSGLGVPASNWPQVEMVETGVNQDACKGATVTFTYSGSAQGGHQ